MIAFQLKRTLKIGVKSLWLHKLRTGLTVLGITFGVCSVIAMLAIGTGASEEAQDQIKRLGSNNIIVQAVKPPASAESSDSSGSMLEYGLKYSDVELVNGTVPYIDKVVPARKLRGTAQHADRKLETSLVGTVEDYVSVNNMTILRGRFLTRTDMETKSNSCVLGRQAAETLYPLGDAVGSVLRWGQKRFRVVGIVTSLPRGEFGGVKLQGDPNAEIYIPFTAMRVMFGSNNVFRTSGSFTAERVEVHEMIVRVEELDAVRPVERVIRHILKTTHGTKEDYQIVVPLHLLVQARRTKRIFSIVLGSIAAISLLVGGIGIMNITLATVMERTREIGIRRAMGAKKRHIIFQFLTETLILSLFGGLLGIVLGILGPMLVEKFANMRTIVTLWSLLLAFGISAAIGILFGIYPAYRAANMDPIEALRHE